MIRLALAASLWCGLAGAHDLGMSPVHPVLDPLPPALAGLTVEVAETLAPQMLVANHTARTLTILDESGRAFLQIGPRGVKADLNDAAWYKSLSTAAVPMPDATRDPHSKPDWHTIDHEQTFGWFDPRLAVTAHAPTDAIRKADRIAATGRWRIPVLLDGTPTTLSGQFIYRPPADGIYVTSLLPPAGFPADVRLIVSQGAIPAILLMDTAQRDIMIVGMQGEDEIHLGRAGTWVNTASPTWQHWGVTQRASLPESWMKVSNAASYTWLEARGKTDADNEAHPDIAWTLPLRIDGISYAVRGAAKWRDLEVAAQ